MVFSLIQMTMPHLNSVCEILLNSSYDIVRGTASTLAIIFCFACWTELLDVTYFPSAALSHPYYLLWWCSEEIYLNESDFSHQEKKQCGELEH